MKMRKIFYIINLLCGIAIVLAFAFASCSLAGNMDDLRERAEGGKTAPIPTIGSSPDYPAEFQVENSYNLGDMTSSGSGWQQLLDKIEADGKYITLDLSNCTMNVPEFNPHYLIEKGKNRIVSMVLPVAATSIKDGPFPTDTSFKYFTNLKTIKGVNVTKIGIMAFGGAQEGICAKLHSVDFPNATEIGAAAFAGCVALSSLYLPEVTSIGGLAFFVCPSLTDVSFLKATVFYPGAFMDCTNLKSIMFPASTTIGTDVYYGNPFSGCTSLTIFELVGTGALNINAYRKSVLLRGNTMGNTELVAYPSISSSVVSQSIQEDLLDFISKVADSAFSGCRNLTSISMESVTTIGKSAFYGCTELTNVNLPNATTIDESAFYGCSKLTSVILPKVTQISDRAFRVTGNTPLTIKMESLIPPTVGTTMFFDVTVAKNVTVRVPSAAVGNYDSTWQEAFKGKGSSGYGEVNMNITLNIVGY